MTKLSESNTEVSEVERRRFGEVVVMEVIHTLICIIKQNGCAVLVLSGENNKEGHWTLIPPHESKQGKNQYISFMQ